MVMADATATYYHRDIRDSCTRSHFVLPIDGLDGTDLCETAPSAPSFYDVYGVGCPRTWNSLDDSTVEAFQGDESDSPPPYNPEFLAQVVGGELDETDDESLGSTTSMSMAATSGQPRSWRRVLKRSSSTLRKGASESYKSIREATAQVATAAKRFDEKHQLKAKSKRRLAQGMQTLKRKLSSSRI